MTELYEKSLRKLELDNVLAQLADCANSEDGKDRCRALLPLDDAEEICLLQQQTTAACGMIVRKGAPGFHELKPVAASLERADRGGCLTPVELLRIAGVLRCIRNVKAYYSEDGEPTVLDVYFQELSPNRYLEEKITNSILSEEEIADAASSELADIRRFLPMHQWGNFNFTNQFLSCYTSFTSRTVYVNRVGQVFTFEEEADT